MSLCEWLSLWALSLYQSLTKELWWKKFWSACAWPWHLFGQPLYRQASIILLFKNYWTLYSEIIFYLIICFTNLLTPIIGVNVWLVCICTDSGPVVVLKHGSVRGQYMKAKGSEKVVEQYLGIPFAQPPVGPLRLAAPGPVQGWEGIRNATQHPSMWVYGYINKSNCNISVLNSLFTTKLLYIYSTYTLYIHSKNRPVKFIGKYNYIFKWGSNILGYMRMKWTILFINWCNVNISSNEIKSILYLYDLLITTIIIQNIKVTKWAFPHAEIYTNIQ